MLHLTELLGIIVIGLALGRLSLWGISFGTSAILFVAMAASNFGLMIPEGFGTLGLAIFVYCVGISAGPTFFRGLASNGRSLATIGAAIVLTGFGATWCLATFFKLPPDLSGGLLAGALTSTPALGAITETSSQPAEVAVGFGVAYPLGILAVVLFVQLALKLLQTPSSGTELYLAASNPIANDVIQRRVVEIINPGVVGKRPGDLTVLADSNCQISRVRQSERWRPIPQDFQFKLGDQVVVIGQMQELQRVAETLGKLRDDEVGVLDADHERKQVVVTAKDIYGRTLKELRLRSRFGVTVARIRRHDIEFVPSSRTRIEFGDTLTLVGEPANLAHIERVVGHRPRTLNETDLLSLAIGLGLGIFVGNLSVDFGSLSVSLGIAGGPLLVGLILGHFRRIGPIRGSFPPAAQLLLTEGGLALFLADAGIAAGRDVVSVVQKEGPVLLLVASIVALLPMFVGFFLARRLFKQSLLSALGATCGGMTSTPGLAVLTGSTDSSQPVTSYVAAYPVALVMVTILAPLLVRLLNWPAAT